MLLSYSCDRMTHPSSSSDAESVAEQFCVSYFSLHYAEAMTYCTDDSKKWLRFAASNIHESDLETLRADEDGVSVSVIDMQTSPADSTGSATVRVRNYLSADLIDGPATMVEEGFFHIDLVKQSGQWTVRMAGLPRSERQSRD